MPEKNKSSPERLKNLINRHYSAIIVVLIAILTITALIGLWRLSQITPQKEPIRLLDVID